MKRYLLLVTTVAAIGFGGSAFAQVTGNESHIDQEGGQTATVNQIVNDATAGNYSNIDQDGTANASKATVSQIAVGGATAQNDSEIWQKSGGDNEAIVNQQSSGFLNTSIIDQENTSATAADKNKATVNQNDDGAGVAAGNSANYSKVDQFGSLNEAEISQTGTGNTNESEVTQGDSATPTDGISNKAYVNQSGTGNTLTTSKVAQFGNLNEAQVDQTGLNNILNESVVNQHGVENLVDVDQGGESSSNKSKIDQGTVGGTDTLNKAYVSQGGIGNTNDSTVTQTGSSNFADVKQGLLADGAMNVSTVTQAGSGIVYVTQN